MKTSTILIVAALIVAYLMFRGKKAMAAPPTMVGKSRTMVPPAPAGQVKSEGTRVLRAKVPAAAYSTPLVRPRSLTLKAEGGLISQVAGGDLTIPPTVKPYRLSLGAAVR